MIKSIVKYRLEIGIVVFGLAIRMFYAFLFNHSYDFINILALVKSVAETGSLLPGFTVLQKFWQNLQLYGKIYYQIPALWLHVLEWLKILEIKFILDTKPYSDAQTYLTGLNAWGVPLYQLTSIKLIQIFWDAVLLVSMIGIVKIFKPKNLWYILLFWSINPFTLLIGYAIFMSDLAMIASCVAGVWFWILAVRNPKRKIFFGFTSIFFLALGGVIKQMPLLIIPFVIILLSDSKKQFILFCLSFVVSYFILSQYWTTDGHVLREFFMMSKESMALFDYDFNGISVFFMSYIVFFLIVLIKKNRLLNDSTNLVVITTIVILIVYMSESAGAFFVQFYLWIIPFCVILAVLDKKYTWTFVFSSLAMIIKIVKDSDYMSTLMSPAIGANFSDYIQNAVILKRFINIVIYSDFLHTITMILFLTIGIYLLTEMIGKRNLNWEFLKKINDISFPKYMFVIVAVYLIIFFVDFYVKSRFILIPQKDFALSGSEIPITLKPISVKVNNSPGHKITAVQIFMKRKKYETFDALLIKFYSQNKLKNSLEVPDIGLPTDTDSPYIAILKEPISEKEFVMTISKKYGFNEIILPRANFLDQLVVIKNGRYQGYDGIADSSIIDVLYPNNVIFATSFRGPYTFHQVIRGLGINLKQKPLFYAFYFTVAIFLMTVSIIFVRPYINKEITHILSHR